MILLIQIVIKLQILKNDKNINIFALIFRIVILFKNLNCKRNRIKNNEDK